MSLPLKTSYKPMEMIRLSPATDRLSVAQKWFHMELDGVVAKRIDLPYQSGKRTGMEKIKKQRTGDCVVGGFRYLEKKPLVGSLLLGLYEETDKLDHVGFTSSIHQEDRPELTKRLRKLIHRQASPGKLPEARAGGAQSDPWNGSLSTPSWSQRCNSITSLVAASATEQSSCDGVRIRILARARWHK